MRNLYLFVALVIAALSCPSTAEVLDSLVATVNGHAILASDWHDELRYQCFLLGKSQRDLTPEERRTVLERLIDQELMREQMSSTDFKVATPEEIEIQLKNLEKQYAPEHGGRAWEAALSEYGITETDVTRHLAQEVNSLRLVDARLRPLIQVDAGEVRDYYNRELLPKMVNGEQTPLQQAAPKIRELLVQKKMNEALSSWLESLRTQGQIHILAPPAPEAQVAP